MTDMNDASLEKIDVPEDALAAAFNPESAPSDFVEKCSKPPLASLLNVLPQVELAGSGEDAESVAESAEPAKRFGRYELYDEIGSGGMGTVFRARDVQLGRQLAIKILRHGHRNTLEAQKRFITEVRVSAQLQHPGIPPVYELGEFERGQPYLTMKLVQGKTLSKLLAERDDPPREHRHFLEILEQVCQTLAFAHARGVIHRDLKPSNVMVGSFGEVQVMDWGVAKVLRPASVTDEAMTQVDQQHSGPIPDSQSGETDAPSLADTHAGTIIGTPAYMPPEQAGGKLDRVDERTDVLDLGRSCARFSRAIRHIPVSVGTCFPRRCAAN